MRLTMSHSSLDELYRPSVKGHSQIDAGSYKFLVHVIELIMGALRVLGFSEVPQVVVVVPEIVTPGGYSHDVASAMNRI